MHYFYLIWKLYIRNKMLIKYIKSKRWGNQNSKFNLFGNWIRWKPYTEFLFIKMVHFIKKSERRKLDEDNSNLWIELFQIIYHLKIQFHALVEATFQANEICCYEVNMKFYPSNGFFSTRSSLKTCLQFD